MNDRKAVTDDPAKDGWGYWHKHPSEPPQMSRIGKNGKWEFRDPTDEEMKSFIYKPKKV